jgi:hypothetical protein
MYTGEMAGTSNGRGGKNPVFPKTEDFDYELSPYTALSRDFRVCIFQIHFLLDWISLNPNFENLIF